VEHSLTGLSFLCEVLGVDAAGWFLNLLIVSGRLGQCWAWDSWLHRLSSTAAVSTQTCMTDQLATGGSGATFLTGLCPMDLPASGGGLGLKADLGLADIMPTPVHLRWRLPSGHGLSNHTHAEQGDQLLPVLVPGGPMGTLDLLHSCLNGSWSSD
jgi:hypothetical protein